MEHDPCWLYEDWVGAGHDEQTEPLVDPRLCAILTKACTVLEPSSAESSRHNRLTARSTSLGWAPSVDRLLFDDDEEEQITTTRAHRSYTRQNAFVAPPMSHHLSEDSYATTPEVSELSSALLPFTASWHNPRRFSLAGNASASAAAGNGAATSSDGLSSSRTIHRMSKSDLPKDVKDHDPGIGLPEYRQQHTTPPSASPSFFVSKSSHSQQDMMAYNHGTAPRAGRSTSSTSGSLHSAAGTKDNVVTLPDINAHNSNRGSAARKSPPAKARSRSQVKWSQDVTATTEVLVGMPPPASHARQWSTRMMGVGKPQPPSGSSIADDRLHGNGVCRTIARDGRQTVLPSTSSTPLNNQAGRCTQLSPPSCPELERPPSSLFRQPT